MNSAQIDRLPWHQPVWEQFAAWRARGQIPHAIALTGSAGLGKSQLAVRIARALLCPSILSNGDGCGRCRSCRLQAGGSHPDYLAVHPEGGTDGPIRIDQIRHSIEFLLRSSQYNGYRVAVVDPAECMTLAAGNGLLKTLEEPPAAAVIILVAGQPSRLPVTLRSRCRLVRLQPPPAASARDWLAAHCPDAIGLLEHAGGAPLRAISFAESGVGQRYSALVADLAAIAQGRRSPVLAAESWAGGGLHALLELLQLVLADLARSAVAGCDTARIPGTASLQSVFQTIDYYQLHEYIGKVMAIRRALDQPLNEQLAIEDLLIGWRAVTRGEPKQMTG